MNCLPELEEEKLEGKAAVIQHKIKAQQNNFGLSKKTGIKEKIKRIGKKILQSKLPLHR